MMAQQNMTQAIAQKVIEAAEGVIMAVSKVDSPGKNVRPIHR